uniref:Uncharacterized protein n=1 Tax=Anopheles coluzzii TaxID=1518534 RepID=A0A8W7PT86_ANOCL
LDFPEKVAIFASSKRRIPRTPNSAAVTQLARGPPRPGCGIIVCPNPAPTMPLSVTTKAPSAGEKTCSGVDRLLTEPPSPVDSRTESPAPPLSPGPNSGQPPPLAQPLQTQAAPGVDGILSTVSNFSVINYVGKIQKQSSYKSSTGRCRTPYDRSSSYRAGSAVVCRITEPPMDDTTNSSTFSSLEYGCSSGGGGSSSSSTTSSNHSTGIGCDTSPEGSDQLDSIDTTEDGSTSGPRLRSRRSMSVSSSGCSSSMDDRNFDFSPLGSIISCRCNSYSMSDFDDDGFREDSSVSSAHGGEVNGIPGKVRCALRGGSSFASNHKNATNRTKRPQSQSIMHSVEAVPAVG